MNTNTMTRPLVVSDDDIVSVVSKPQAKRAAAIQGQEFVQQVAPTPTAMWHMQPHIERPRSSLTQQKTRHHWLKSSLERPQWRQNGL